MINKVILVGNVGIDPEVRAIESGVKVARCVWRRPNGFSIVRPTNRLSIPNGIRSFCGAALRMWWIVSCARAASSISRGSLRTREWMDKENQKRYTTEIIASDMKLLGKRSDNPAGGQSAGQGGYQPQGGVQGGYAAPASQAGGYAQPAAQPVQPAAAPVVPPAEDPDDLPF